MLSAVLLVVADALRLIVLPHSYQSGFADAFEAIVVFLAAAACLTAARQSSGIIGSLWTTIALYFALNLAADVHDFVADTPLGVSHAIPTLEFLGWCTYLPLALIMFFPISEDARLRWKWIPVIDFIQVAIAATVACFELMYLYHRNLNDRWTQFGHPEAVRNTLICTGLLLRSLVDPSRQSRKIYNVVGLAFTGITLAKLISPSYEAVAPALIRPAAFMVIGIFAMHWDDSVPDCVETGQRRNRLRLILSILATAMLVVVLLLVNAAPLPYRTPANFVGAVSVVLFVLRSTIAEYTRYGAETALRESEDRYRDLVENSEGLVCTHDLEGNLLSVNASAGRLLGYEVSELLRMPMRQFVAPEFRSQFDQYLHRIRNNGSDSGLLCVLAKDGRRRIWEYHNTLRTEGVAVPVVRGMARDITDRKHAEDALRESEDRYRDLVENTEDLICTHDLEGRLLTVNAAAARILGYTVQDLLHMDMRDLIIPEGRPRFDEYLERMRTTGGPEKGLLCVITRSGEVRTWEYSNTLRKDGLAKPIVRGMAHDITERRRAELARQLTEQRYRTLFEKMVAGVAIGSMEGIILDCNDALARFFGHNSAAECRGAQIRDYYADPTQREKLLGELRHDGVFINREWEMRRKDGTRFWVLLNSVLLPQETGEPLIQSTMFDISKRKRAEEALRRSEENYRNFVTRSSEGIFRQDVDAPIPVDLPEDELVQRILHGSYMAECNDAMVKMYGLNSIEDFVGRRLIEFVDPKDPANLELTREYIRSGFRVVDRESFETDAQGNPKVFRNSMIGIVQDGKLVRTWGIQRDVTEHVKANKDRAEAQKRLQDLVASVEGIVWEADPQTCEFSFVSQQAERMLGYPVEAWKQCGFWTNHLHEEDRDSALEFCQQATREARTHDFEFRMIAADGRTVWLRGIVNAVDAGPQGKRLRGIMVDITERKRAEETLRQSEERFRVALKDSPITVFNQDRDLRYTWLFNPQLHWQEDVLGKTDDEIIGPKRATVLNQMKRRVLESGVGLREEVAIPNNGRSQVFDVTIEPLFDTLGKVAGITAACMDIARLREMADRLQESRDRLANEKSYLQSEIQTELGFEEIIGQSPALREVLKKARIVAPTDSTVLLLGETGTGKELVARSIHGLSSRNGNTFVKLNCAAVPSGLLESELFGHEKGAFTGAVNQKIGRIELADKGTLFLDEIGEMPPELQPKLLRVLQDREFERLGGVRTLHVDVRIISATNRDLRQDIADKKFREDLFYRLNVFPIVLPPLRDRRDDIEMLVEHFVRKYSARMGKRIDAIPEESMHILCNWNWPGNVRELENMIERMVIMSKGSVLAPPPAEICEAECTAEDNLTEMEREHILRVLRETNGVLSGTDGAAIRLGLKRTTLQSMIKRLGIHPHEYRNGGATGTLAR